MISVSLEIAGLAFLFIKLSKPFLQTKRKDNTCAYQTQTGGAMVIIQLCCKTNESATGTSTDPVITLVYVSIRVSTCQLRRITCLPFSAS